MKKRNGCMISDGKIVSPPQPILSAVTGLEKKFSLTLLQLLAIQKKIMQLKTIPFIAGS